MLFLFSKKFERNGELKDGKVDLTSVRKGCMKNMKYKKAIERQKLVNNDAELYLKSRA